MSNKNYHGEQWRRETHAEALQAEKDGHQPWADKLHRSIIADGIAEREAE